MPVLDASGRLRDSTIDMCTRLGTKIDNTQVWEYSRLDWQVLGETLKRFSTISSVERVSDACPVYNCHGLTLGSRRTQVTDIIFPILEEDGYERLPSEKDARTGDVVVYCGKRGEVIHSGFVLRSGEILLGLGSDEGKITVPMVWSKWGKGCEMVHPVEICPYFGDEKTSVRYYRLKRWEPSATTT
jgi:hypothetical protein